MSTSTPSRPWISVPRQPVRIRRAAGSSPRESKTSSLDAQLEAEAGTARSGGRSRAPSTSAPAEHAAGLGGQARRSIRRASATAGAREAAASTAAPSRSRLGSVTWRSPSSASMRALSKPSSSRPRTSMTGTRSVGIPILAALSASSRAASASRSTSLSANGILRSVEVLARGPAGAAPRRPVDRDHGRRPRPAGAGAAAPPSPGEASARAASSAPPAATTRPSGAPPAPRSRTPRATSAARGRPCPCSTPR